MAINVQWISHNHEKWLFLMDLRKESFDLINVLGHFSVILQPCYDFSKLGTFFWLIRYSLFHYLHYVCTLVLAALADLKILKITY